MKNQDVVKNETKVVAKYGVMDSKEDIIVPFEYDFVEKINENLYVATKGSINGLRYATGRIRGTVEHDGTYGVVFEKNLEKKILDTEVDFYTKEGKFSLDKKVKAAYLCPNDGMFLIVDENYKWSFAMVDYFKRVLTEGPYTNVDNIKMDYHNNRFIIKLDQNYTVISFNNDNSICKATPYSNYEPLELFDIGIMVKNEEKYGLMDYSGEMILKCRFDVLSLQKACIVARRNKKTEFYTCTGHFIAHGENSVIHKTHIHKDLFFIVLKSINSRYSLYSSKKQLLPCEYSSINLYNDYAIVNQDGKYALLHYDKELDEMIAVHPIDYPKRSCKKMKFVYDRKETYVEVEGTLIKKKYIINLE